MYLTANQLGCCGAYEMKGINQCSPWKPIEFFIALSDDERYFGTMGDKQRPRKWGQGIFYMTYAIVNEVKHQKDDWVYKGPKGLQAMRDLQRFIRQNNLGILTICGPTSNPRYEPQKPDPRKGHTLYPMVYRPNNDAVWQLMKEHGFLHNKKGGLNNLTNAQRGWV